MPMPHLLDIQTAAFETLLVPDDVHGERQDVSSSASSGTCSRSRT